MSQTDFSDTFLKALFFHDDWRVWSKFDEHSNFALIVGAHSVVCQNVDLIPPSNIETLKNQGVWPKFVFQPKRTNNLSCIYDLLDDIDTLNDVKSHMDEYSLEPSFFYPNHPKTDDLLSIFGKKGLINPPTDDTHSLQRALYIKKIRRSGIAVLEGQLHHFATSTPLWAKNGNVVCKAGTSSPYSASADDVFQENFENAIYVEECAEVTRSLSFHYARQNAYVRIGANTQIIENFCHIGNDNTFKIPAAAMQLADETMFALDCQSQVVGIDVLETPKGYFVGDVNERYNTSTYIHLYLNKIYGIEKYRFQFNRRKIPEREYHRKVKLIENNARDKKRNSIILAPCITDEGLIQFYELTHHKY